MKKILSLSMALIMVFTLCAPASALGIIEEDISMQEPIYGYTFIETKLANGNVELRSYYNGEFQKKYTIQPGAMTILVESAASDEPYTINSAVSVMRTVPAVAPNAERWAACGYINYNEHVTKGEVRAYVMAYGNSETKEVPLNVQESTPIDNVVAFLTSYILSHGLDLILESKYPGASQIARGIVSSIIGERGVAVINGIIQSAFTDTVKAYITDWDFKATPFMDSGVGDTIYLYNQGRTQLIMHTGNVEWDETSEGFTVYDWRHSTLALNAWNAMFPGYTCPGIMSYTSH